MVPNLYRTRLFTLRASLSIRFELAGAQGWGVGEPLLCSGTLGEEDGAIAAATCLRPLRFDRKTTFSILFDNPSGCKDTSGHKLAPNFSALSLKHKSCAIACASECVFVNLFGLGDQQPGMSDWKFDMRQWVEWQDAMHELLKKIKKAKVKGKTKLIEAKVMSWFEDPSLKRWRAVDSVARKECMVPVLKQVRQRGEVRSKEKRKLYNPARMK